MGILIPFAGTAFGAAGVFFLKETPGGRTQKLLFGFAAGVMMAASVWSLLIPSMTMSEHMGTWAFVPAVLGFVVGVAFLLMMDRIFPVPEEENAQVTCRLLWAVTLHNLPEGMAVGVAFAGAAAQNDGLALAGAFALAVGIAIQNIPEGTIISMPMKSTKMSKGKSFLAGVLSGAIEPVGAVGAILLSRFAVPVLPYLLAFSAGAMICVTVSDLIPQASGASTQKLGVISFSVGFLVMMTLDVVLG